MDNRKFPKPNEKAKQNICPSNLTKYDTHYLSENPSIKLNRMMKNTKLNYTPLKKKRKKKKSNKSLKCRVILVQGTIINVCVNGSERESAVLRTWNSDSERGGHTVSWLRSSTKPFLWSEISSRRIGRLSSTNGIDPILWPTTKINC